MKEERKKMAKRWPTTHMHNLEVLFPRGYSYDYMEGIPPLNSLKVQSRAHIARKVYAVYLDMMMEQAIESGKKIPFSCKTKSFMAVHECPKIEKSVIEQTKKFHTKVHHNESLYGAFGLYIMIDQQKIINRRDYIPMRIRTYRKIYDRIYEKIKMGFSYSTFNSKNRLFGR